MGQEIGGIPPLHLATQAPSGRLYLDGNQAGLAGGGIYRQINLNAIMPNFVDGIEDVVNHIITPGVVGFYQVNASLKVDHPTHADVSFAIHVLRNPGSNLIMQKVFAPSTTDCNHSWSISDEIYISAVNQNLEMGIVHQAAANQLVVGQFYCTFLSVQRVR